MKKLVISLIVLTFCLPSYGEILVYKTTTNGFEFDLESETSARDRYNSYLVLDADLTEVDIPVNDAQEVCYAKNGKYKQQWLGDVNGLELIPVMDDSGKMVILKVFNNNDEDYALAYGKADRRDIGAGKIPLVANRLKGHRVWHLDGETAGSAQYRLTLDTRATKNANKEGKTASEIVADYQLMLNEKQGYMPLDVYSYIISAYGGTNNNDIKAVVAGNRQFALDLYARLKEQSGNLFFSPHSISTALAMTYAGARGQTEEQMAQVLHFSLPQERLHPAFKVLEEVLQAIGNQKGCKLSIANALWGQKDYTFLEEFLDLMEQYYGAGLNKVDFENNTEGARQTINRWVMKKTNNKIKDLIKPGVLDEYTRLVLTNAIYFYGTWKYKFDRQDTRTELFTIGPGETVLVPMMSMKENLRYWANEDLQVLELPYVGKYMSMIVLLPNNLEDFESLENSLTIENLNIWLAELQEQEVEVYLPKFDITSEFNLSDVLAVMGMSDAFMPYVADFSGMDGTRDLFISAVVHKAFVAVNEEGTEAAAATAVAITVTSVPQIPVFRADHPFVFLIRDNESGNILFIGRVMNPNL